MRTLAILALALATCGTALAQNAAAPCPPAWEVTTAQLLGSWRAERAGDWDDASLALERHPEYDGFRGTLKRGSEQRFVAGDVDEGDFTLEESVDGLHIAATWIGEVVEGSCGREIRGTWKAESGGEARAFVLRKQ
ncbi:hypothetical protein LZ009_23815 [Ramlibacter sp. XY19]|uniref:hypothetical protein n=1 Tax=Ramlibacter paludis TaxID=2908000 RepID=UPI0023DC192A|nr:hypothetical protein [Ramlibacter paludis]MCG2595813.1 hypothetical protein [Ramlibacter paludis]